jgi:hypothetical protein
MILINSLPCFTWWYPRGTHIRALDCVNSPSVSYLCDVFQEIKRISLILLKTSLIAWTFTFLFIILVCYELFYYYTLLSIFYHRKLMLLSLLFRIRNKMFSILSFTLKISLLNSWSFIFILLATFITKLRFRDKLFYFILMCK